MTWLDDTIGWVAPQAALKREQATLKRARIRTALNMLERYTGRRGYEGNRREASNRGSTGE